MDAALLSCAAAARERRTGSQMKTDIERVLAAPGEFLADPIYAALAKALTDMDSRALRDQPREQGVPYRTWGSDIDEGAHEQMRNACRLPVSVAAALMPDAHLGIRAAHRRRARDGGHRDSVRGRRGHRVPHDDDRV
jgi:tRNA-splicing ligase RtcB